MTGSAQRFDVHLHLASMDQLATLLTSISERLDKFMSAISDFAVKQQTHNDKINKAVDDIAVQIKTMSDLIATLQTSPGTITPADQATLDQLEAAAAATETKVTAMDTLAAAPPVVPVVPPVV